MSPGGSPGPWRWALPLGVLAVLTLLAFSVGQFPVSPGQLLTAVAARLTGTESGLPPTVERVIWDIRLPRVLAALVVGAALAAAGAAYQSMFRNPLVSPDLLGVTSGAALGAILGIVLGLPVLAIQGLAFTGGLLAVGTVYGVAGAVRRYDPTLVLVLSGIAVGVVLDALSDLLTALADPYDQLPAITYWRFGSLASVTPLDVLGGLPVILVGLAPLVLFRWRVDLLTLGEDEAKALGVDTARLRLMVVVGATLVTATAVSISGPVSWLGLLVPHMARLLVGPSFARLLPASLVFGAAFLLGIDTLARTLGPTEVPLRVLTAILGAPFFLWLIIAGRRGWT